MMNFRFYMESAAYEYHWKWIIHLRRRAEKLVEGGESMASTKLLALSRQIDHHGMKAFRCEDYLARCVGEIC